MSNEMNNNLHDYVSEGKGVAWLSYFGILVLIPILLKKDNPFVKFHVRQGIALLIAWICLAFICFIPFIGWIIGTIGWIFLLVLTIWGIISALQGKETSLPLINALAEKINF